MKEDKKLENKENKSNIQLEKEDKAPLKNISRTTIFLNQKKRKSEEEEKTSIYYPRYGKVSSNTESKNSNKGL